MPHNVIEEPILQTDAKRVSLPGLLAAMSRGEVAAFPALRPHQEPAWHMFLVQLATMAMERAGYRTLQKEDEFWRDALRNLTPDFPDDAPWRLVVEGWDQPAFLQPPCPAGLKWHDVNTPDALDMIITSRNHDLKCEVLPADDPELWFYALVSLQTMEGYGGAGNHGIARMNGGSSSRPMLTLAPVGPTGEIHPSIWWQRDVRRMLDARKDRAPEGHALIWILPWPEKKQLLLYELDPLFIEVCRRVRLVEQDGKLNALKSTSKESRIAAKSANGNTGDPWAPIEFKGQKSLTLGENGRWGYRKLHDLLHSGIWKCPELAELGPDESVAPMMLVAMAFARGNSKTGGYHSRNIPVPKMVVPHILGPEAKSYSENLIEEIWQIQEALRYAIEMVAAQGPSKIEEKDKLKDVKSKHYDPAKPAEAVLDRAADNEFYQTIWEMIEADTEEIRLERRSRFICTLIGCARDEFRQTLPAIPCSAILRPRAEARGWTRLEARFARILDAYKDDGQCAEKEMQNG